MGDQHVPIVVGNSRIFFPYQPYETQRNYMESVTEALETKQNALLESPTGTGKTLSLLCSSLAWLQRQSGPQAKSIIYYTSRTHIQLAQAAKELKRTAYGRNPAVVIGSRAQMCLNDDVRQTDSNLINRTCRNAIAKNACSYYTNYEQKLEIIDQGAVHDIEDLANFGRAHQCCPYYASKKIAETKASIVFMPYNYLLDTSVRKSFQLKIDNSVIIFDEAHNIEGVLKDSVSGSFTESSLRVVQESCDKLPAKVAEALNKEKHGLTRAGYDPKDRPGSLVNELAKQKPSKQQEKEVKVNPIEELAAKLTNEKLQQVRRCAGLLIEQINQQEPDKISSIETVFYLMRRAGIEFSSSSHIIETLESMASFWSIAGVMNPTFVARHVSAISNLAHVATLLFPEVCTNFMSHQAHEKNLIEFYAVYIKGIYEEGHGQYSTRKLKDREFNLWCLNPAIGLRRVFESTSINGPRSMIVTSGTLAPMELIEKELGMKFKIQKSFAHVIGDNQLKVMFLSESFNSFDLKSHFEASQKDIYLKELGETLVPLFKILPFGTLVFFPSYSFLNRVIKFWRTKSNIWQRMNATSSIFQEQTNQDLFNSDIAAYKRKTDGEEIGHNQKAVFFGVCRGKLSEGTNLKDNQCRTVIVIGLPFPNSQDPRVISTRKFHSKRDGHDFWYSQQMRRALNQTIGRVIRSRSDFGLLLLCDPRFMQYRFSLSEWTRKFFPTNYEQMNLIEDNIKQFFKHHGINITESATQDVGAFQIGLVKSLARSENWDDWSDAESAHTSQADPERRMSAEERQAAMVAQYTVNRDYLEKVKKSRLESVGEEEEEPNPKRPKTTRDAFDSIFSQAEPQIAQASIQSNPLRSLTQQSLNTQSVLVSSQSQPSCPPANSQIQSSHSSVNSQNQTSSSRHNSQKQTSQPAGRSQNPSPSTTSSSQNQLPAPSPSINPSTQSQTTDSSRNYSIINQVSDKDRPTSYTCSICKNGAVRPHSTNCECAKVACETCIIVWNRRKCYKCQTMLKKRDFKPVLFKSAFFSAERQPVIVVNPTSK